MASPKQQYTPEQRADAVDRIARGETLAAVARDIKANIRTVRRWIRLQSIEAGQTGGQSNEAGEQPPAVAPREPLPWYRPFLTTLANTCHVGRSAKKAGIDRRTAYQARREDPAFAEAWQEAKAIGAEVLEDEAVRRAYKGWLEPVFYKGEETGTIRKFDSGLLTFLLRGAMPEKYRDRSTVDLNAAGHITFGYDDE